MNSDRPVTLARYITVIVLLLVTIPLAAVAQRGVSGGQYGSVNLKNVPAWKQVGEWSTHQDNTLSDIEMTELEPDDYLSRIYAHPSGLWLDYLVVYGHLKKTFHEPAFCLPGGGFNIEKTGNLEAGKQGLPVSMGYFLIQKEYEEQGQTINVKLVVLYSYLQGDHSTPNLAAHNWNLLKARMGRKVATGAFVRVIIPVAESEEAAIARATEFLKGAYPDLNKKLHAVPRSDAKAKAAGAEHITEPA